MCFRLAHEGLESIVDYMTSRKIDIPKEDLLKLLANTDPQKSPEIGTLSPVVQEQVKNLSPGSCILCYKDSNNENSHPLMLNICGWRGTNSLRCYITDFNAAHYLRLLDGDCSKYGKYIFEVSFY